MNLITIFPKTLRNPTSSLCLLHILSLIKRPICSISIPEFQNQDDYTHPIQTPPKGTPSYSKSSTVVHPNNVKHTTSNPSVLHDPYVICCNRLITSHIRAGDLQSALRVFSQMPIKSTITWNSLLAGYSRKSGMLSEARQLFDEMPEPDIFSYNTMLSCYLRNSDVDGARLFFERMPVKDIASWNTMVTGFAENGMMFEAQRLFSVMPEKNVVSWNAMISGYVGCGDMKSALKLFESDPFKSSTAQTALITGHMKAQDIRMAETIFEEVEIKTPITWNAMIAGYVENSQPDNALKLFKNMLENGVTLTPLTLTSTLLGCSNLSALILGKQIHQFVHKSPLYHETTVGTSLLSMYCKCGALNDSWKLFSEMQKKDLVTWSAMICGFATHGAAQRALALFNEMKVKRIKPDWITFVGVLKACTHAGLVELGMSSFDSMVKHYRITPKPEHYSCIVDLLGRAGRLKEATELIQKMPFKPHTAIFGSLLGSARIHKDIEVAEFAANSLLTIDRTNVAAYVQLANVYAVKNLWDDVSRVWQAMKTNKMVKRPGCSWIEVKNTVHEFRSSETEHPELPLIHRKLDELDRKMKLKGYVPNLDFALHDVGREQKEKLLLWHSEKLAIAYGLIKLPPVWPIRIFKNLRVCGDCHEAIKYVSSIEGREIIVRDNTRFHHFIDGRCSCGDYW